MGALVAAVALGCGLWAGGLRLSGNIHEVEPGRLYRSAQLGAQQLQDLVREKGIRMVINLRGPNVGSPWYDQETAALSAMNVRHLSIRMSANREPTLAVMSEITGILSAADGPVLVHCEGGADRTGLVSALYEFEIKRRDPDVAATQLSFRYGHFPWLTSRTGAMDSAFKKFVSTNARDRSSLDGEAVTLNNAASPNVQVGAHLSDQTSEGDRR